MERLSKWEYIHRISSVENNIIFNFFFLFFRSFGVETIAESGLIVYKPIWRIDLKGEWKDTGR